MVGYPSNPLHHAGAFPEIRNRPILPKVVILDAIRYYILTQGDTLGMVVSMSTLHKVRPCAGFLVCRPSQPGRFEKVAPPPDLALEPSRRVCCTSGACVIRRARPMCWRDTGIETEATADDFVPCVEERQEAKRIVTILSMYVPLFPRAKLDNEVKRIQGWSTLLHRITILRNHFNVKSILVHKAKIIRQDLSPVQKKNP